MTLERSVGAPRSSQAQAVSEPQPEGAAAARALNPGSSPFLNSLIAAAWNSRLRANGSLGGGGALTLEFWGWGAVGAPGTAPHTRRERAACSLAVLSECNGRVAVQQEIDLEQHAGIQEPNREDLAVQGAWPFPARHAARTTMHVPIV